MTDLKIFFGHFFIFLLTTGFFYGILKVQRTKEEKEKEDTPMQKTEEPAHPAAYRKENDGIARIPRLAVGP